METSSLEYTYLIAEDAIRHSDFGHDRHWFFEEIRGFDQCFSSDICVVLPDPTHPKGQSPQYFKLVRVQHKRSHEKDICGGGHRHHPGVDIDPMKNLAIEMTVKHKIMGTPYIGAKGGIAFDPRKYTPHAVRAITEKATDKLLEHNVIGPFKDRLAPDYGTSSVTMDWITERYGYQLRLRNKEVPYYDGIATAKSGTNGIPFRKEATGVGLHYAFNVFRRGLHLDLPEKPAVAVNGCGNVGLHYIKNAQLSGSNIVAVSDVCDGVYGGVYKPDGLPVEELVRYVESHPSKSVQGFEAICDGMRISDRMEFFSLPVDIFVPAALERDITEKEAAIMQCKVIIEGANSPTTKEGDAALAARNILVIPDTLANSLGAVCSYFEHAHCIGTVTKHPEAPVPASRDDDTVHAALKMYMLSNGRLVLDIAARYAVSYRIAAFMLAFQRLYPKFVAKRF